MMYVCMYVCNIHVCLVEAYTLIDDRQEYAKSVVLCEPVDDHASIHLFSFVSPSDTAIDQQ